MNLYHVTKFSPYFSFTVYCFYTKISSFMPVLSIRIALDCFYLLIFYSEKFSTAVCRLPYAVNVNLNLSIVVGPQRTQRIPGSAFGISLHPFWQIDNGFFLRPIMTRTQILVRRWRPSRTRISALFRTRTLPQFSFVCGAGYYEGKIWLEVSFAYSKKSHLAKRHCRLFTRQVSTVDLIEAFSWSKDVKTSLAC